MNEAELARRAVRLAKAERAYETRMGPARLPWGDPARVPYPETVRRALAAYDRETTRT